MRAPDTKLGLATDKSMSPRVGGGLALAALLLLGPCVCYAVLAGASAAALSSSGRAGTAPLTISSMLLPRAPSGTFILFFDPGAAETTNVFRRWPEGGGG